MAGGEFFGRYYKLKLGNKTFETKPNQAALDIRFDVRAARGQICKFGTVSILGLGFKQMNPFLELAAMDRGKAETKGLKVELTAGYFSKGKYVTIIKGHAYSASVSSPPEPWLTLQVSEVIIGGGTTVQSPSFARDANVTKSAVAAALLKEFKTVDGKEIVFKDMTGDLKIGSQLCTSGYGGGKMISLDDAINSVQKLDPKWTCVMIDGIVYAYPKETSANPRASTVINKGSGLLSVTGINVTNATITTFLDEQDPGLDGLNLTSEMNPHANGLYTVTSRRFTGHFTGNQWYTEYTCTNRH